MKYFFILIFASSAVISRAQYPFEKYSAIKYKIYRGWKIRTDTPGKEINENNFQISIPHFFGTEHLKIELSITDTGATSYILLYKGKKLIQKISEAMPFNSGNLIEPVWVEDVNGDGLSDIKLIIPYMGCGLASMNMDVIYLFQNKQGRFVKVAYMDKLGTDMKNDWENRLERDIDGDGNYEIITMYLQGYKEHNYWTFNLYNYKNDKFVNVNDKFDYPIMVQFLYRENYKPANFSKTIRKKYSLKEPGIETDD